MYNHKIMQYCMIQKSIILQCNIPVCPTFIDGPGKTLPFVYVRIKQALYQWLWCLASANGVDVSSSPGEGWQEYWLCIVPTRIGQWNKIYSKEKGVKGCRRWWQTIKRIWSWASQLYEEGTPTSTEGQGSSPDHTQVATHHLFYLHIPVYLYL